MRGVVYHLTHVSLPIEHRYYGGRLESDET
jgi:hypothetical protein